MIIEAYTDSGTRVRVGDEFEYDDGLAYVAYISLTSNNKIEHIVTINVSDEYGITIDVFNNHSINKINFTGKNCKKVYNMMKEISPN